MPSWRQVSAVFIGFVGTLVGIAGFAYAMVDIPDENKAATAQNNVYYWADGSQMVAAGGDVNRQNITYEKIPMAMRYAVISAENKTFETDKGVDPVGITRALFNMAKGGETQGGSTITQQYVKNSMLDQSQTLGRKFKELFISIKVGAKVSKPDIITGYLNTSYFGRGAYGLQAASQTYYGTNAEKLNPSQCAFLAALLKGPTYYDPIGAVNIDSAATPESNKIRSEQRWSWILDQEVRYGHMTAQERAKWTKYPIPLGRKVQAGMSGQISYLVETANNYVTAHSKPKITADLLTLGGYQIYTTFEKNKVNALNTAVKDVRKKNIKPGGTHKYLGDSPEYQGSDADTNVQFGAASVVPGDGRIVAIYGGEGYEHGEFNNNANTYGVPVGSTFKPFVLAAAMEYGTNHSDGKPITPDSKYNANDKLVIKDHEGNVVLDKDNQPFKQKNENENNPGYLTLKEAMQWSINTPFVQLGEDVGLTKVRETALNSGLLKDSMEGLVPSFSIGTSTPSAIRMADAYGTFAKSGVQVDPYSVTKVLRDGEEQAGFQKPKPKQAMPANVADNVTKVLENVVEKGTGTKALALGRTVAGKTGTTDSPGGTRSAWFVGYTQQYSTAVVMFRQDSKAKKLLPMSGTGGASSTHGGEMPATVWTNYMKSALGNTPDLGFPAPTKLGPAQNQPGAPTPKPSMTTPPTTPSATATPPPTITTAPTKPGNRPTPTTDPTATASPTGACMPWDPVCNGTSPTPTNTTTSTTTAPTNTKKPNAGG
jgi:membrane peptidoglycan carboxypeptidase